MYIVMDSSVLIADYRLRGKYMNLLLEQSRDGKHKVAIPKLVFEEVAHKWREQAWSFAQRMTRELRALDRESRRLGFEQFCHVPLFDWTLENRDGVFTAYLDWLARHLNEYGVQWLELPKIAHSELASLAVQKRKPFKESGAGYRDALIWESVKELALSGGDSVALVSTDHDFGSDGKFHADLLTSLAAVDLSEDRVMLFSDTEQAVEALVQPSETALEWFVERFQADSEYRDTAISVAIEHLNPTLQLVEQNLRVGFARAIEKVHAEIIQIGAARAWVLGRGRVVVELEATFPVDILIDLGVRRSGDIVEPGEADFIEVDGADLSRVTVRGTVVVQLEVPEAESALIYDAYAFIERIWD